MWPADVPLWVTEPSVVIAPPLGFGAFAGDFASRAAVHAAGSVEGVGEHGSSVGVNLTRVLCG